MHRSRKRINITLLYLQVKTPLWCNRPPLNSTPHTQSSSHYKLQRDHNVHHCTTLMHRNFPPVSKSYFSFNNVSITLMQIAHCSSQSRRVLIRNQVFECLLCIKYDVLKYLPITSCQYYATPTATIQQNKNNKYAPLQQNTQHNCCHKLTTVTASAMLHHHIL